MAVFMSPKLPLEHSIASIVNGDVRVLLAVLRELGQYVWKTHIPHRLKQPGDTVSPFSPAGLAVDGYMQLPVLCC